QSFSFMENDGKPIVTKARPDNPNGKHLAGRYRERSYERQRDSYREERPRRYEEDDRRQDRYERQDRSERPAQFERRDRYSFPNDRPVPSYAKKGSKNRFKSSPYKKPGRKGR
ncbi:MAG: hypothetical protein PHN93_09885, partial [Sphaerochaetaceae bacterium]|nr:hypothetical protein [Sphaerochaetaceae bacterium]